MPTDAAEVGARDVGRLACDRCGTARLVSRSSWLDWMVNVTMAIDGSPEVTTARGSSIVTGDSLAAVAQPEICRTSATMIADHDQRLLAVVHCFVGVVVHRWPNAARSRRLRRRRKRSKPSTIAADAPQTGKMTAMTHVVTRRRRASFTSIGRSRGCRCHTLSSWSSRR